MTPTSEQLEQLSAYLDNELPPPERAMVESRLSVDAMLRGELESLRRTVTSVRGMPRVTAPASIADEVTERLARRELLGDGNARRAGEVVRFATFLRRFAVAAVLVLAAGVGWRFWYSGRGETVIGGSASPMAGAPGAAQPAGLPESSVGGGVRSAPKREQLAKSLDRDAAAPADGNDLSAREEKLAFGNQLPPGGAAFDTRAKAMGATSATKPGFSVRADAMLPSSVDVAAATPPVQTDSPTAGVQATLPAPPLATAALASTSRPSRTAEFGVESTVVDGTEGLREPGITRQPVERVGSAVVRCGDTASVNDVCQGLFADLERPEHLANAMPQCALTLSASQSGAAEAATGPRIQIRGRRSAVARYLIAVGGPLATTELGLAVPGSVVVVNGLSEFKHGPEISISARDAIEPQPDGDPTIQVVVVVVPPNAATISPTPSTSHAP